MFAICTCAVFGAPTPILRAHLLHTVDTLRPQTLRQQRPLLHAQSVVGVALGRLVMALVESKEFNHNACGRWIDVGWGALLYALGSTAGTEILFHERLSMKVQEAGLIVLYRWRLHPGMEALFVEAWSRISDLLRSERGSLGSRLHRGSDGLWYSYAQWPSAEARERAFSQPPVDAQASEQMRVAIAERFPEIVLEAVADFLVFPSNLKG